MHSVKFTTFLTAVVSLMSFAGCASHTVAHHKTNPHGDFSADKDGRYFNPVTRNFDPPPPFGPRSNGSH